MSVDISDPSIPAAYNEVIGKAATNWLLLRYGNTNSTLTLYETGSHGLEELRGHLKEEVLFGLLSLEGRLLLLVYMPDNVSGVKRARALVHSRTVGNTFRAHDAVLTASRPSQVEEEDVRAKLGLSLELSPKATNFVYTKTSPRSQPAIMPPTPPASVPRSSGASFEQRSPIHDSRGPVSAGKPPSAFEPRADHRASSDSRSSSHRRVVSSGAYNQPSLSNGLSIETPEKPAAIVLHALLLAGASAGDGAPPPPPPKSELRSSSTPPSTLVYAAGNGVPYRPQGLQATSSMAANVTHSQAPCGTQQDILPSQILSQPIIDQMPRVGPPQTEAQLQAAMSRAKWQAEEKAADSSEPGQSPIRADPVAFAEAEHLKRENEVMERTKLDAEEQQRLYLEEIRRLEAAQRLRQEEMRHAAETKRKADEAQRQATAERQRQEEMLERQRRMEEEVEKRRRAKEDKRLQREKWMEERANMEDKFRQLQVAGAVMLTGWASHQVGVVWRRRYFQLRPDCLLLFKNAEEITRPVGDFPVADIEAVHDARDELQLPHSVRVDFKGSDPAYFYCDSQEDTEVFIAALNQAAAL